MSKSVILATLTVAAFIMSGAFADAAMTPAKPAMTKPAPKPVALMCAATKGDVAQTLTVTNDTKTAVAAGTKISWTIGKAKGTQLLIAALKVKGTVTVLAPPGNGGPCTATYQPK